MKTNLKYILFVLTLMATMGAAAQGFAQQPTQSAFQSTSTMMRSGSTLPQAATTGAVLSGEAPAPYLSGSYSPNDFSGPRRGYGDDEGNLDGEGGGQQGPDTPVGPVPYLFMLALACGYGYYIRRRRAPQE